MYGDVHVGTIAKAVGNPNAGPQWQWNCGFYPGSRPGECSTGSAESFDQARDDFLKAWTVFLSKRTEADFDAWREQRDWTERKYAACAKRTEADFDAWREQRDWTERKYAACARGERFPRL